MVNSIVELEISDYHEERNHWKVGSVQSRGNIDELEKE